MKRSKLEGQLPRTVCNTSSFFAVSPVKHVRSPGLIAGESWLLSAHSYLGREHPSGSYGRCSVLCIYKCGYGWLTSGNVCWKLHVFISCIINTSSPVKLFMSNYEGIIISCSITSIKVWHKTGFSVWLIHVMNECHCCVLWNTSLAFIFVFLFSCLVVFSGFCFDLVCLFIFLLMCFNKKLYHRNLC